MMNTVLGKVILEKTSGEEFSPGGLLLSTTPQKKGKVLAVGHYAEEEGIELGDIVFYTEGKEVTVEGKAVLIVDLENVLVFTSAKPHLNLVDKK